MESPIEVVRRFCAAWSDDMAAADLAAFFTDDAVYHNIPLAAVTGREEIANNIASFVRPGPPGVHPGPELRTPAGGQEARDTAQGVRAASGCGDRSRSAIAGHLIKQTIEHVLEFRPDIERHSLLPPENSAERHAFCGLPLPAKVIEVDCGRAERAIRRFHPRLRIQRQLLGGIELGVGIHQEQRLAGNPV